MSVQSPGTTVFVARQPVFDSAKRVFGYELLARSGQENYCDASSADAATLDVISSGLLVIGLDELTGGKRGFIKFTRHLLVEDVAALLPSDRVIIEIFEDTAPDEDVLTACRRLKDAGYMLVLDDFALSMSGTPLLELADMVKVDVLATARDDRKRIAADLASRGIQALAKKVESVEVFDEVAASGYSYFQGYFFAKPDVRSARRLSSNKLSHLRMLKEVNRAELSYDQLETVIKQDVALTYNLLRFINSAWFGLRYKVTSIKHALVLLGPKEIRKWFAMVALRQMGTDKPNELLRRCMARAKMAELAAPLVGLDSRAPELFLTGMFSVIDALLDTPMQQVMEKLPLDDHVKAALMGEPNLYKTVLDAILAYEKGEWDDFLRSAAELRLDEHRMPAIYTESLKWANDAFAVT
jgi:EAL and modified HD-GYP domain-containing signal transduction protein